MKSIKPSSGVKLSILVKGNYFIIGFFFFLIGSILSIVFISNTDFVSLLYINEELTETKAIVNNIEETNCRTNDNKILEYEYRFLEYDKTQLGSSYSCQSTIQINDTVQIEFVQNNPKISRIIGMTNAPYDIYVGGFVIFFPLLGLGFIFLELKRLNRYILILKDYSLTTGDLELIKKTTAEINESPLYKMTYIYEHHQKKYISTFHSSSPKEFSSVEALVYSRTSPHLSVLLKKLPIQLQNEIKSCI